MESPKAQLLQRAGLNRQRARKCRDLIRLIENQDSIAMLEDLARDLEAAAATLEAEAAGRAPPVAEAVAARREQRKSD